MSYCMERPYPKCGGKLWNATEFGTAELEVKHIPLLRPHGTWFADLNLNYQ